ncbi:MAG: 50S ribosomal protein L13 [Deltaproteobacteria bacterium]|nr:50S ribosomal protein L13 [Candidatus Anaeroferrophillacea bacterium]
MKTTVMAKHNDVERAWYVVDARNQTLGRLATRIATVLRGKHKAAYTPHVDTGDFVIIVNAGDVRLTGNKWAAKMYYRHTGYPGGIKGISAEKLVAAKPEEIIRQAVKGMLPKNRLGRQMFKKLKVYAGGEHPHEAQQPKPLQP